MNDHRQAASDLSGLIRALPDRHPEIRRALVAFSGGVDSTALLWLAARQLPGWSIAAVHVNHGLQPEAERWAEHCAAICEQLRVPLQLEELDGLRDQGAGLEAAARAARYDRLAALVDEQTALLSAHHRDDQAETLLIQLLRGAGPRGLAAMPAVRRLGAGLHLRPLLDVPRQDLVDLVAAISLRAVSDPMNADPRFLRARIRRELIPLLAAIQPGAASTLPRTSRLCAEATEIVHWVVARELDRLMGQGAALPLATLDDYPRPLQAELLRGWIFRLGLPTPQSAQLESLCRQVRAREDSEVCVAWPGAEIRRFRGFLHGSPPLRFPDPGTTVQWSGPACVLPAGAGRLEWAPDRRRPTRFPELVIGFRRGGERIRLAGEQHHRTLKNLFQEAGVPPWERQRMPLVHHAGQLVAVGDRWVAETLRRLESDYGMRLRYLPSEVANRPPPAGC